MNRRDDLVLWRYRTDFSAFNRFAFRELHPAVKLHGNWHISLMADRLERCARGEIRRLIINVPPRSLKSHTASVAFPLWALGRDPSKKIMAVAGTRSLVADLSAGTDRLLRSDRLRAVFPNLVPGPGPGALMLAEGGRRMPVLVGASQIGRGADIIIIDDPMPAAVARDDAARARINRWFDDVIPQRLNDKSTGVLIVVMQRLHQDDLTGHLLAGRESWEHLSLPAVARQDEAWTLRDGRVLARRKGKVLAPEAEGRDQLRNRLHQINAANFAAQYQQDPRPVAGPGQYRTGAFHLDSGRGYPQLVFTRVPEANYLQREIFGDEDVFAPPRPRPLSEEEWAAMEADQMEDMRETEEWFRLEFVENPAPGGPRTLPPGIYPAPDADEKDEGS